MVRKKKEYVKFFNPPPARSLSEHFELCLKAEKWLNQQHCKVVIRDPFRAATKEQPDAIGWRDGISILIECKVTRADFLADKNKCFRAEPNTGMGDWRFYLCPPGIIAKDDLPDDWGLLYATEKTIKKMHGIPPNTRWHSAPFTGNKRDENVVLTSALRRLAIRGYLPDIYKGYPIKCDDCNEPV